MSGRIQGFHKAKRTRVKKLAHTRTNPHRSRWLADKRRRVAARNLKAAEAARKAAIPAGA